MNALADSSESILRYFCGEIVFLKDFPSLCPKCNKSRTLIDNNLSPATDGQSHTMKCG